MVKETYYTHKRDLQIYWHTLAVFRDGALVGLELLVLGGFRAPRAAAAFLFLFHQPPGRVGRDYCAALLYTYIHIYIYMYIYVYTQSHTHTFTHTQSHTHTHTHTHSHTHTHTPGSLPRRDTRDSRVLGLWGLRAGRASRCPACTGHTRRADR